METKVKTRAKETGAQVGTGTQGLKKNIGAQKHNTHITKMTLDIAVRIGVFLSGKDGLVAAVMYGLVSSSFTNNLKKMALTASIGT